MRSATNSTSPGTASAAGGPETRARPSQRSALFLFVQDRLYGREQVVSLSTGTLELIEQVSEFIALPLPFLILARTVLQCIQIDRVEAVGTMQPRLGVISLVATVAAVAVRTRASGEVLYAGQIPNKAAQEFGRGHLHLMGLAHEFRWHP